MRRSSLILILTAAVVALPVPSQAAPTVGVIVVLHGGGPHPAAHARASGALVTHVFENALQGWSGMIPVNRLQGLRAHPSVRSVEVDGRAVPATTQSDPPWGLDRIDQRARSLSDTYTYNHTGLGVTAYVVDSGIRLSHVEFGGRAVSGVDMVDGGSAEDCSGHGTQVASIVGGATVGVARDVRLVSVRVMPCAAPTEVSTVIAGIDWVTAQHVSGDPAVATLSLAAPASPALDAAAQGLIDDGITVVVAAGNGDVLAPAQDACGLSPARVPDAITVGATGRDDTRLASSNIGPCLDLFAPGGEIPSASEASDEAASIANGTSAAAAHVAGVAALYLQGRTAASPGFVRSALATHATRDIVVDAASTNAHLLFTTSLPAVTLETSSITFGGRRTGTTAPPESVLLTNTGDAVLTIGSAVLSGPEDDDFRLTTDTCSRTAFAPGESCAVAITFSPGALGERAATLTIPTDADGSPDVLELRGSGVVPHGVLDVTSIDFGAQRTGLGGTTMRYASLQNTGSGAMTVLGVEISGTSAADFAATEDGCAASMLEPGDACSIGIAFTPGSDGDRTALLSITTDAPNAPHTVSLGGIGFTPTPGLTVSPSSLNFGDQAVDMRSTPRTIFLSSTGPEPVSIDALSLTGADTATFSFTGDGCSGRTLAVGASCTATVAMTPTELRAYAAEVEIASNAPGGVRTIPLSGRGVTPAPALRFSAAAIGFGAREVGTTSPEIASSVTNSGSATLAVGTLTLGGVHPGDFAIASNLCDGRSLAPSTSCPFSVRFTPSTTGSRSAWVEATSNAAGSPHRLALGGTGAVPAITVTPTSLVFPDRLIGTMSDASTVTVRNAGSATLSIGTVRLAGTHPGDFATTFDGCGRQNIAPGATCAVAVAFAPVVAGARSARIEIPSNAGATKIAALSGVAFADLAAPVSTWLTQDDAIHIGGYHSVTGKVFDDITGVDRVAVTFTHVTGLAQVSSILDATTHCSLAAERRGCLFSAPVPVYPGIYDVTASAHDFAGNVESPGPTVRIRVV